MDSPSRNVPVKSRSSDKSMTSLVASIRCLYLTYLKVLPWRIELGLGWLAQLGLGQPTRVRAPGGAGASPSLINVGPVLLGKSLRMTLATLRGYAHHGHALRMPNPS